MVRKGASVLIQNAAALPTEAIPDDARMLAVLMLAKQAYLSGYVRVAERDIGERNIVVASRQGLFAVSRTDYVQIAHGLFFGAAIRDGDIFAFEACDAPAARSNRGRIVKFVRQNNRIIDAQVLATGLDNGCHQIDFFGDRLCVVNTYDQSIIRFSDDFSTRETLRPLPEAPRHRDWSTGYVHCNSLLQADDQIFLLHHNGGLDRNSEVATYDHNWHLIETRTLPGRSCHNLAMLENGALLSCGSMAGELIDLDGVRAKVSSMMTRGLCVGTDQIVIGASAFSIRRKRNFAPGTVTFLDRCYRKLAVIDLPASPTEIRLLTGPDRGQSNWVQHHDRSMAT